MVDATDFIITGHVDILLPLEEKEIEKFAGKRQEAALVQKLIEAEKFFQERPSYPEGDKEKELLTKLSLAYRDLKHLADVDSNCVPEDLASLAARIFYLYGRAIWATADFSHSKTMFQAAVTCQFVAQNIFKTMLPLLKADTLAELPALLEKENKTIFALVNDYRKTDTDENTREFVEKVRHPDDKPDDKEAYNTAKMLRWLGGAYQNLEKDNYPRPEFAYEKTLGAAEAIFNTLKEEGSSEEIRKEANWAAIDMRYNTGPFLLLEQQVARIVPPPQEFKGDYMQMVITMRRLLTEKGGELNQLVERFPPQMKELLLAQNKKYEEDVVELFANLLPLVEKEITYSRAQQLFGQIYNRLFQFTDDFKYLGEAIRISEDFGAIFDPFLKNMFKTNKAYVSFQRGFVPPAFSQKEAYEAMKGVIDYCDSRSNNPHKDFPGWYMFASRLATLQGDEEKAAKFTAQSYEIAMKLKK
jgi:hypothetical protein